MILYREMLYNEVVYPLVMCDFGYLIDGGSGKFELFLVNFAQNHTNQMIVGVYSYTDY